MLNIFRPLYQKQFARVVTQCACNLANDSSIKEKSSTSQQLQVPADENAIGKGLQKHSDEMEKDDQVWRTPWHQKDMQYYNMLRTFYSEDNNVSALKWLQQPINLSPSAIKKWWANKKEITDIFMQQYLPERHQILGPELACAHFIVFRGGAVKFHNENKWIKAVDGEFELPGRYRKDMFLQAIDCTDMKLRYEGLCNLRDLRNVEWLSLRGCQYMDDFCMDVISNIFSHSLLYLDVRDCFGISEKGLGALYKMRNLKTLYLDDMLKDTRYELTCLLLQELNPDLQIKSDVINFEIK